MAYKQSPAKVIKGQMTNKAAGLAHGDSMAMMGFTKNKEQNKKPQISTGRKILNTAGQLIKDVGYQAIDKVFPNPSNVLVGGSRKDKTNAQLVKQAEQKNYDISRDRVKKGETYFSVADAFDDSGYGLNPFGKKRKRKNPGSLKDKNIQKPTFMR